MCSDGPRNHGCGQKKPEGTSSCIFGVGTAAKCCELKRCADQVHSSPRRQIRNLNFLPSIKKTTEYFLSFFFPLIKLFLTFVVFAKTWVTMRSCAKSAGYSTGLSQVYATSYWWPCGVDGRSDGRSRDYYVISKISWPDRLPNLLSNGAPLGRYACGLR